MSEILLFRLILEDIFKLKNRVGIFRKPALNWGNKKDIPCMGIYEGESTSRGRFKHTIRYVYKGFSSDVIFSILAHEFVHAWQMENGLELEHEEQAEYRIWAEYFRDNYEIEI